MHFPKAKPLRWGPKRFLTGSERGGVSSEWLINVERSGKFQER